MFSGLGVRKSEVSFATRACDQQVQNGVVQARSKRQRMLLAKWWWISTYCHRRGGGKARRLSLTSQKGQRRIHRLCRTWRAAEALLQ